MTAVMTDTVAASRPDRPTLRALGWVTWRQHRAALTGITVVLAIVAATLWWYGHRMHADFTQLGLADCALGRRTQSCTDRLDAFSGDQNRTNILTTALLPLPVLFGLFIGAPLLAREYESGTYRFAFTQGAGRTPLAGPRRSPCCPRSRSPSAPPRLSWSSGGTGRWSGLTDASAAPSTRSTARSTSPAHCSRWPWAFSSAALIRRVVPAIGVTLAAWIAWFRVLRDAAPPAPDHRVEGRRRPDPRSQPWIIGETWTAPDGHVLNATESNNLLYASATAGHKLDAAAYLASQGYHYTPGTTSRPAGTGPSSPSKPAA